MLRTAKTLTYLLPLTLLVASACGDDDGAGGDDTETDDPGDGDGDGAGDGDGDGTGDGDGDGDGTGDGDGDGDGTGDGDGDGDGDGEADCDADVVAPVLEAATPANDETGVNPIQEISLDLSDGCGIDWDTVQLTVDGFTVSEDVSGDDYAVEVSWTPPDDGLDLDAVVTVSIYAEDLSGNVLDTDVEFRVWDELWAPLEQLRAIHESNPDAVIPENWALDIVDPLGGGNDERAIGAATIPGYPEGTEVLDAELLMCGTESPTADTVIECWALNATYVYDAVTWNKRSNPQEWSAPGASHVPQDRQASPLATLEFPDGIDPYAPVYGDATDQVQAWVDGEDNNGLVCEGDQYGIEINGVFSNCPPVIVGHVARPMP